MSLKSNEKYVGRVLEVLVESYKNGKFEGRTRNNKVVHITGNCPKISEFVNVKINRASTWCLFADSKK